jgi:hypothetical protein
MTTILSKFNEQLLNFLQEMCRLFPEDKKLSTFLFTVDLMKKANPRELMNQFKQYVYPFKSQIINKDESFFLENAFGDSIQDKSNMSEMLRIKEIWISGKLTKNDKDCIWNYFKVFIYLLDKEYPSG